MSARKVQALLPERRLVQVQVLCTAFQGLQTHWHLFIGSLTLD